MPHVRRLSALALAVIVGASAAACVSATPGWTYAPAPSVTPPPSAAASGSASGSPAASGQAGGVKISALNIAYEQSSVTAPAGKAFQIEFDNKDAGVPHNVSIHKGDANGTEVFKGEIITGPATTTYDVPALDAGTYTFVCSVHPNMTGTLTVQ